MPRTRVTETVFRDANQSLIKSRMRTEDMVAVAPDLDCCITATEGAMAVALRALAHRNDEAP